MGVAGVPGSKNKRILVFLGSCEIVLNAAIVVQLVFSWSIRNKPIRARNKPARTCTLGDHALCA
eukprot:scaffold25_cov342-Pavlova_lutheri.AAC.60